jgi:hypothetical protein
MDDYGVIKNTVDELVSLRKRVAELEHILHAIHVLSLFTEAHPNVMDRVRKLVQDY